MNRIVWLVAGATALAAPSVAQAGQDFQQPFQVAEAVRPLVSGERVRVQKMVRDINSAMQAFSGESPADLQDPATAKKWQDSVERYRTALARYPQLDDPDVQAATAAFQAYEKTVAGGLSGAGTAAAEAPAAPAAKATATTSSKPAAAPKPAASDVPPLVSGQRVRVKKLARDMESAMQTINKGGVAPFQDPEYAQKWQNSVERFRNEVGNYPQVDDPDVQAAAAKLAEMENLVAFGIREAAKQTAELGDVQAILANIEKILRANRSPRWLPPPFDLEVAKGWVAEAANAKQTAQKALAELQRIAPTAYLPRNVGTVQEGAPYDDQDLDRLMRFAQSIITDVDNAVTETDNNLKLQFKTQDDTLNYFRGLDPNDESDKMNAFLAEGAEEDIYGRFEKELALAESVVAYQVAFGKEPAANTAARVEEIKQLRKTYAENRQKALGDSKLPEPKSTDKARLAIAKEIIEKPRYEFGQHGPIVLTTAEVVDREKQVSEAEIKDIDVSITGTVTLSGTQTTWNYKWQEFKFATPVKDTDTGKWHIWWITAKNFSSGSESTPIGQWISGGAVKGSEILEKNF